MHSAQIWKNHTNKHLSATSLNCMKQIVAYQRSNNLKDESKPFSGDNSDRSTDTANRLVQSLPSHFDQTRTSSIINQSKAPCEDKIALSASSPGLRKSGLYRCNTRRDGSGPDCERSSMQANLKALVQRQRNSRRVQRIKEAQEEVDRLERIRRNLLRTAENAKHAVKKPSRLNQTDNRLTNGSESSRTNTDMVKSFTDRQRRLSELLGNELSESTTRSISDKVLMQPSSPPPCISVTESPRPIVEDSNAGPPPEWGDCDSPSHAKSLNPCVSPSDSNHPIANDLPISEQHTRLSGTGSSPGKRPNGYSSTYDSNVLPKFEDASIQVETIDSVKVESFAKAVQIEERIFNSHGDQTHHTHDESPMLLPNPKVHGRGRPAPVHSRPHPDVRQFVYNDPHRICSVKKRLSSTPVSDCSLAPTHPHAISIGSAHTISEAGSSPGCPTGRYAGIMEPQSNHKFSRNTSMATDVSTQLQLPTSHKFASTPLLQADNGLHRRASRLQSRKELARKLIALSKKLETEEDHVVQLEQSALKVKQHIPKPMLLGLHNTIHNSAELKTEPSRPSSADGAIRLSQLDSSPVDPIVAHVSERGHNMVRIKRFSPSHSPGYRVRALSRPITNEAPTSETPLRVRLLKSHHALPCGDASSNVNDASCMSSVSERSARTSVIVDREDSTDRSVLELSEMESRILALHSNLQQQENMLSRLNHLRNRQSTDRLAHLQHTLVQHEKLCAGIIANIKAQLETCLTSVSVAPVDQSGPKLSFSNSLPIECLVTSQQSASPIIDSIHACGVSTLTASVTSEAGRYSVCDNLPITSVLLPDYTKEPLFSSTISHNDVNTSLLCDASTSLVDIGSASTFLVVEQHSITHAKPHLESEMTVSLADPGASNVHIDLYKTPFHTPLGISESHLNVNGISQATPFSELHSLPSVESSEQNQTACTTILNMTMGVAASTVAGDHDLRSVKVRPELTVSKPTQVTASFNDRSNTDNTHSAPALANSHNFEGVELEGLLSPNHLSFRAPFTLWEEKLVQQVTTSLFNSLLDETLQSVIETSRTTGPSKLTSDKRTDKLSRFNATYTEDKIAAYFFKEEEEEVTSSGDSDEDDADDDWHQNILPAQHFEFSVADDPKQTTTLIDQIVRSLWDARVGAKIGDREDALCQAISTMSSSKFLRDENWDKIIDPDGQSMHHKRFISRTLIFDVTAECVLSIFRNEDKNSTCTESESILSPITSKQFRLWNGPKRPQTFESLLAIVRKFVQKELKLSLPETSAQNYVPHENTTRDNHNPKRLAVWSMSKKTPLDRLLETEMRSEDATWLSYGTEEYLLKNNIADDVWSDVLQQALSECSKC